MKHGIEKLRGLRYKLRMMGIPLTGPSYIYGDNKSQVTNSTRPESTLKKKCNSICYHAVRESVAMEESLITHICSAYFISIEGSSERLGYSRNRPIQCVAVLVHRN